MYKYFDFHLEFFLNKKYVEKVYKFFYWGKKI